MSKEATTSTWLSGPFKSGDRWCVSITALYVCINVIVLANALRHPSSVGYDVRSHVAYIDVLSRGRLPNLQDSQEFYSPPLPYALPALVRATGASLERVADVAQILNVVYSLALTYFLLRICLEIDEDYRLRAFSLLMLGMIGAYYRTMAMVRGEPLLAALACIGIWLSIRTFAAGNVSTGRSVLLGVVLGLAALSRQWGILLFPAVGALALHQMLVRRQIAWLRQLAVVAVVCAVVGGWFYGVLDYRYGSPAAFNRSVTPFSFSNQSRDFYFHLPIRQMMRHPIRPSFANELLPVLYSDLWGDYWAYFLVNAQDSEGRWIQGLRAGGEHEIAATNRTTMEPYLADVSFAAILPSAILLCGMAIGSVAIVRVIVKPRASLAQITTAFLAVCVICTLAGYLFFLVTALEGGGDTIKASYILQIFALLAILAGIVLTNLARYWPAPTAMLLGLLACVALHNGQTFFSHYVQRDLEPEQIATTMPTTRAAPSRASQTDSPPPAASALKSRRSRLP